MTARVFLLSPANCGGRRARQVVSPRAESSLAARLRDGDGVPLGELFAYISGLYFRGKLTYANRFASPPDPSNPLVGRGVLVITPDSGLRDADSRVTVHAITAFAGTAVDAENRAFRHPLERSARQLAREIGPDTDVVLLGSIASPKYVDVLGDVFGSQLRFPSAFVGRGDMSRGGLLLRQAAAGIELDYIPVLGAVRRGRRPAKLPRLSR
jgi:hypothetical protein